MSHLAFDKAGKPISAPDDAIGWQVRRVQSNRGAPQVVYSKVGTPLVVPVEAEAEEFAGYVQGMPGRYRLDPVDEEYVVYEDASSAVVHLVGDDHSVGKAAGAAGAAPAAATDITHQLLLQMAQSQMDLTKAIVASNAGLIKATADVVKAADGAGLAARESSDIVSTFERFRNAFTPPETNDADETPPVAVAPPGSGNAAMANVLAMKVANDFLPMLQFGFSKLIGLTPEQAREMMGAAAATPTPGAPSATPASAGDANGATGHEGVAADASDEVEAPTMTDEQRLEHVMAIQAGLSVREQQIAQAAAMEMTEQQRLQWMQCLESMSIADAIVFVKKQVAGGQA